MARTQIFIIASFMIAKIWEESICLSTGEWINTMWYIQKNVVYSYNRILYNELNIDKCYNVEEPTKYYAEWKKPNTKDHIWYDFIYVKYSEKAKLWKQKADYWLPEDRVGNRKWLLSGHIFWEWLKSSKIWLSWWSHTCKFTIKSLNYILTLSEFHGL